MSVYAEEERIVYDGIAEEKKDVLGSTSSRINKGGEPPTATMEAEKRIRREIANSNERRRMQSINNGFQSLRSLLPHHEGEKLSKVGCSCPRLTRKSRKLISRPLPVLRRNLRLMFLHKEPSPLVVITQCYVVVVIIYTFFIWRFNDGAIIY
jgi:hypothetical protein